MIEKTVTIGDVVEIHDVKMDGACENISSANIQFKKGDVVADDIKLEVVRENLEYYQRLFSHF